MHRTKSGRAARLLAAALAATVTCVGLRAQAMPPARPVPVIPPPPHQTTPDAPLLPDYYALALSHTGVTDDPAWRPLRLVVGAGHAEPAVIVLPVQTQAYGFWSVWRALLGARLDQELQRRHVDASRQTDIVDWHGPFVRRTDDITIATLAAEHPHAALLALHVGHDAADHAFVSLVRTEGGRQRIAHRRIDMSRAATDTLPRLFDALPGLLAELGMGDAKLAPPLPPGEAAGCQRSDWALADLAPDASPVATACHALLMGSLLPDYMATWWEVAPPDTPDRQAWLARAWMESAPLAGGNPSMDAVRVLTMFELGLDPAMRDASSLSDNADVVVRPLARMFWARPRASKAPRASRDATTDSYVETAVTGLPPFAAAVVRQHASFNEPFRSSDLCGMLVTLPYFAVPRGCDDEAKSAPRPALPQSTGQRQLMEAWRVAAAWNDLYVEGHMRASAERLAAVEAAIPPSIANHPLIREMRFAVRTTPVAPEDIDGYMARTRRELADYLQAVATLQGANHVVREYPADGKSMLPAERQDPAIGRALDDFQRLQSVETLGATAWRPDGQGPQLAPFLADGRFLDAQMAAASARHVGGRGAPVTFGDSKVLPKPNFARLPHQALRPRAELEKAVAENPFDLPSRLDLAIVVLEHGDGVAAARRVIDARAHRTRAEDGITETNDLESSGDLFFFTGELQAASDYYDQASRLDMGSGGDMRVKMRAAAIAGDLPASLKQAHAGAVRYQDEWFRADEAGYIFMLGQRSAAWSLLLPRMQTGRTAGFWRSALAGHRMASTPLADLPDWLARNHLMLASHDGASYAQGNWLRTYATLDRLPTPADIALLQAPVIDGKPQAAVYGARVIKTAIDGSSSTDPEVLARDMLTAWGSDRILFMPFYGWALWNATQGQDPGLAEFRAQPLEAGFAPVLAKAMILAADGHRDDALRYLTAARYELARDGSEGFEDEFRTAPYDFVLATWLMTRKTGERAYAEQGLAIARGYQRATEYMAWPYAAEALLGKDAQAREIAACRAQWLDPGSMFLHESGLNPDLNSAVCRKATSW